MSNLNIRCNNEVNGNPCQGFLLRMRHSQLNSKTSLELELICRKCKAHSYIIWNKDCLHLESFCLSKQTTVSKTAPSPGSLSVQGSSYRILIDVEDRISKTKEPFLVEK